MTTLAELNKRALAERIANAGYPAELLEIAKQINVACSSIGDHVGWALDPDESLERVYWAKAMIERAHDLLDLAHEFKHALKPPVDK